MHGDILHELRKLKYQVKNPFLKRPNLATFEPLLVILSDFNRTSVGEAFTN